MIQGRYVYSEIDFILKNIKCELSRPDSTRLDPIRFFLSKNLAPAIRNFYKLLTKFSH